MKKWMVLWLLPLALAVGAAGAEAPKQMSVQVKSGQLRATPSYLGKLVAPIAYGQRVSVLQAQGEWVNVRDEAGHTGWMHQSALSTKRIVMKAGAEDVEASASGEELALAGKGFSKEVEAEFKAKNKEISFAPIDRMEKIVVTPEEMAKFLAEGEVKP
jgi:SH3-like domain-containing protein